MNDLDGGPTRLHHLLRQQAAKRPTATALWWQGDAITYAALEQQVQRIASRLAATGKPGDRVAVLAWNCPEFVELIYAIPASGRVLVPLNARLSPAEQIHQLQSAQVSLLIGDSELLAPLCAHGDYPQGLPQLSLQDDYQPWLAGATTGELPVTGADDPAWILYTSGTTGRPKGAILTHSSFLAGLCSAALGRPVDADDRYFYPFPLFHIAAHNVLLQHQYGAAVVLSRSFEASETLRSCRELQVNTMSLAPTMIGMLLDHPDFKPADLASVRTIGYGASAMPQTLLKRLFAELDVGLCQSYGMTELSGSAAFLTVEDHQLAATSRPELLKSVGKPLSTVQIKLQAENGDTCATGSSGEILVKAEQCMSGYWQQPKASADTLVDGWLHTGDIGRFDTSGYLHIVDRKKDMIISGGENIASREVEEVLRTHPAIGDCAVIGLPDPKWGETICAVLVCSAEAIDSDLREYCLHHLAGYKTPRHWHRVDSLPTNASGKVDKALLRRTLGPRPSGALEQGPPLH